MFGRLALRKGGIAAAVCAVAVLAHPGTPAVASPASQQQSASRAAATRIQAYPLAPTAADRQRVAAYWSPERLKRASSYEPRTKPSSSTRAMSSSAELAPARAAVTAAGPAAAAAASAPPMVGKVFFKVGDKEYWCSASVVHSQHRNLVATAGHCAFALNQNKPVENWIFIPSYRDGKADAGIFVGHTLYMHEDFSGKGDFDRDYAFVTVHRGFAWQPYTIGGKVQYRMVDVGRLEDKVGAFRFAANLSLGRKVTVFGYPAGAHPDGSRPYSGQSVVSCAGTTERKTVKAPTWQLERGVRLPHCGFTSGASGGPWVVGYNAVTRTGYLVGITSLTWNLNGGGRLNAISTPYFNAAARLVYLRAARQATG